MTSLGEDNYGLNLHGDAEDDSGDEYDDGSIPELNMEQLLMGNSVSCPAARSFLMSRRRLEPLPEEEDSLSVSSGYGPGTSNQVGWW